MIPVRMGSKRVKNKNLRMLGDKPLVQHIIDAAKGSKYLSEIYINSEAEEFKEIAQLSGVNFYQRSRDLASDEATNDQFALDFIENKPCDIVIQLLATSPFVTTRSIDKFIESMINNNYETMISVFNVQIESLFENNSLNFDPKKPTPPSQSLIPVQSYACSLMGWNTESFVKNMKKYNAAYHGGDGSIGYFEVSGFEKIDIDYEDDFQLAEAVYQTLKMGAKDPEFYTSPARKIADADRERILINDGVDNNILYEFNKEIVHIEEIIKKNGRNSSWSHTLVNSPSTCSTLIAQMPGEGNRMHYHPDWDEWWFIIEGEWEWMIEGVPKSVRKGDVVFIERNRKHKITAKGDEMAIRMAVSRADVDHVYDHKDY